MVLSKSEFIYIVLVIAGTFLILSIFFISVLVINARNRRNKKIEMLEASLDIQEKERRRIAKDLHDDIGIILSSVIQRVSIIPNNNPEKFTEQVGQIKHLLDKMVTDTRSIIRNLAPPDLTADGLIECIERTGRFIQSMGKFQFNFIYEGVIDNLSENAKVNLYRIINEMLNNTVKHSNGNLINLSMKMNEKELLLIYSDNGKCDAAKQVNGMGLNNIRQRASMLNGHVSANKDFSNGSFYHIIFQIKYLVPA
jgi:two-component system, NarL family, sensor kinase